LAIRKHLVFTLLSNAGTVYTHNTAFLFLLKYLYNNKVSHRQHRNGMTLPMAVRRVTWAYRAAT